MKNVRNAKDITLENVKMHCLIYGKPKTGKRLWACSAPKPFVFDFDNGMLSLRGSNVPYKVYEKTTEFINDLNELVKMDKPPYETLVFSSLSTLQHYYLEELLILNNRKEKGATLHERGMRIDWLTNLMLQLNKAPFNTIVITHEETVKNDLTGAVNTIPMVAGQKLPEQLPAFVDEVYRTKVGRDKNGNPTYNLITVGDESMIAGSRLGCLPRAIDITFKDKKDNRGFNIIMDFVKGKKT